MKHLAFTLLILCSDVSALDTPGRGIVYNTREDSSITFSCDAIGAQEIECDFNQTAVRRKAKSSELDAAIATWRSAFAKGERMDQATCKLSGQLLDIFEGRVRPPKGDMSQFSPIQRRDGITHSKAVLEFCRAPSEANFVALGRMDHDKKTRTCAVSSNAYKARFRVAPESNGKTWLEVARPDGVCGVVQLNRFEADAQTVGTSRIVFWKYIARKAITNPGGQILGASCSGFDQSEYLYDWKEGMERGLGCDYITFSPV